jgi:hypothetical protein
VVETLSKYLDSIEYKTPNQRVMGPFKALFERQKSFTLTESEKNVKLNIMRGDFNEYVARKYFKSQKCEVVKTVIACPRTKKLLVNEYVLSTLKLFKQKKIANYLWKLQQSGLSQSKTKKNNTLAGLPDLFCWLPGSELFFFVECKAVLDEERFNEDQKRTIKELLKLGSVVKVFCTQVKISLSTKPTEIYELKLE